MTGFAYRIADGRAEPVEVDGALGCGAPFVWVHLATTAEHAQAWLRDKAKLEPFTVDALTANETRPRCEKMGDSAFLNLRGRTDEEIDSSDMLASIRIWAAKGRLVSVTRKKLVALDAAQLPRSDARYRARLHACVDIRTRPCQQPTTLIYS